jgi:hypothetical protein
MRCRGSAWWPANEPPAERAHDLVARRSGRAVRLVSLVLALVLALAFLPHASAGKLKRGFGLGNAGRAPPDTIKEALGRPEQQAKQRAYQASQFQVWTQALSEGAGSAGHLERQDAARAQAFLRDFYASELICKDASRSVLVRNRAAGEGLGSLLNGFMISAMHALMRGQRLCSNAAKTVYVDRRTCSSQTWDCLFEAVSPDCPCSALPSETLKTMRTTEAKRCLHDASDVERINEKDISNGANFFVLDHLEQLPEQGFPSELVKALPRRNDHWWMGQLYGFYLRPNAALRAFKDQLQHELFPEWEPVKTVSVHLRRGDHWMGVHLEDDAYLATIRAAARETGAHTVLLGTDDIAALRQYPDKLAPLRVISIPANYSILGQNAERCVGLSKNCTAAKIIKGLEFGSDEGRLLMTQIYLMAESRVTIGTMGSNFGRLIHQLQWFDKSKAYDLLAPDLVFLEMSGDRYFICGWRLSMHTERQNADVVAEWLRKYRYFYPNGPSQVRAVARDDNPEDDSP